MKKLFSLCLICLLAVSAMAQRAAVMEFKAGSGISQADVDGISAIFITYFRPSGYTMVERTQIDRVIEEQGFQRSRLTESQMVRIGQILNVSKIVIGDVNNVMDQYNVDVRVINVESGTIAATEGATFSGSSYRASMQSIAQKLASKIAIGAGPSVSTQQQSSSYPTQKTRSQVETVYGYLHVFPNELGVFQGEPSSVIYNVNNQKMHGYDEWRLPTNEELSLLRANGYLSGTQYMTKENTSGMVLLVTTGKNVTEKAYQAELARQRNAERQAEYARQREARKAELSAQGYVNLGLPSGTWWRNIDERASEDEYSRRYYYDEAQRRFGDKMPSKKQFEELIRYCSWKFIDKNNGFESYYLVTGPNGNSISLRLNACCLVTGEPQCVNYWSRTLYGKSSDEGVYVFYCTDERDPDPLVEAHYPRSDKRAIRTVVSF